MALGLLVTVIFGADALNDLATNGVFNLGFLRLAAGIRGFVFRGF
ncbi:MAG: hypothetical protein WKG07_18745 [Hymenobacter sp.]